MTFEYYQHSLGIQSNNNLWLWLGSQWGGHADRQHQSGDREDHSSCSQQRDCDQEGDIRSDHRVVARIQWLLSLRANIQNQVRIRNIFGCDSSPRSPNVSVSVCVCVTLATTVLDFCRTSAGFLQDFCRTLDFIVCKIFTSRSPQDLETC